MEFADFSFTGVYRTAKTLLREFRFSICNFSYYLRMFINNYNLIIADWLVELFQSEIKNILGQNIKFTILRKIIFLNGDFNKLMFFLFSWIFKINYWYRNNKISRLHKMQSSKLGIYER